MDCIFAVRTSVVNPWFMEPCRQTYPRFAKSEYCPAKKCLWFAKVAGRVLYRSETIPSCPCHGKDVLTIQELSP
jgi:hypothetical protein